MVEELFLRKTIFQSNNIKTRSLYANNLPVKWRWSLVPIGFCSIWFDGLMSTHSLMLKVVVGKKNVPFLLGVRHIIVDCDLPYLFFSKMKALLHIFCPK